MDIQALIITPIKTRIWEAAKQDLGVVKDAMAKAGTNDNSEKYWKRVLRIIQPLKKRATLEPQHEQRYTQAYLDFQAREFPLWTKDGHAMPPRIPDTATANGLTQWIVNYCNWCGNNATRINVQGQHVTEKYEGRIVSHGYRKTTTRSGQADVRATIRGKSVQWEVKVGRDKPSPAQLKEQARERKAGGEYFFVKTVEEFFSQYDSLSEQKGLFS